MLGVAAVVVVVVVVAAAGAEALLTWSWGKSLTSCNLVPSPEEKRIALR